MLFNSYEYAIFLPLVFLLYWFVFNRSLKLQNAFLLLAGYVFYGWWDWRFLFLIAFSTLFDFGTALVLEKTSDQKRRKWLFAGSCLVNLGLLGLFKYYNFFIESLAGGLEQMGYHLPVMPLQVILPLGISFYTFQSLSYTADVYLKKVAPSRDLVLFASYISFFPQLVAGPIERAAHLMPQFSRRRVFNASEAANGMREMLWGFFKKIVIADSCAIYVDDIFTSYAHLPGSTLFLGAVYFAIQIYCDFSGYSSIARGTARLFGFSLVNNFNFPYFSKSVSEFWRRWHVSLSTWFRDYVFIPLGGSYGSRGRTVINVLIVFVLSGLWHGANSTFIAWGFLNGLLVLPSIFSKRAKALDDKTMFPSVADIIRMTGTFLLITFTWIFFRSDNISAALDYIERLFSPSLFEYPVRHGLSLTIPLVAILFLVEWVQRNGLFRITSVRIPFYARWGVYLLAAVFCLSFYRQNQTFIYFQF
jgi:alginate O-acetyltransferase complex protein AlgI